MIKEVINIKSNKFLNRDNMRDVAFNKANDNNFCTQSYYEFHSRDCVTGKYSFKTYFSNEDDEQICIIVENI